MLPLDIFVSLIFWIWVKLALNWVAFAVVHNTSTEANKWKSKSMLSHPYEITLLLNRCTYNQTHTNVIQTDRAVSTYTYAMYDSWCLVWYTRTLWLRQRESFFLVALLLLAAMGLWYCYGKKWKQGHD